MAPTGTWDGRWVTPASASPPPLQVVGARRDAVRLLESPLAPWQKLDALRCFITPRLTYCLRLGIVLKGALAELDKALRWRVKGMLGPL